MTNRVLELAVGYFDRTTQLFPAKWKNTFDEIVVRFN